MSVDALTREANSPRRLEKRLLAHVAIIALGLVMIYPPLWMLSSSFKPAQLIFSEPGLCPREITLDNWAQGWVGLGIPFSRFFLNSAVIAGLFTKHRLVGALAPLAGHDQPAQSPVPDLQRTRPRHPDRLPWSDSQADSRASETMRSLSTPVRPIG
jgi:hypothetical protein